MEFVERLGFTDRTLKFNSKTSGENIDGTAVFVKRGISCQLIVERKVDTFENFRRLFLPVLGS